MDRTIVDGNDAARARLRAVLGRLGEAEAGRDVDGDWTVGAVLGHLAFWDRRTRLALERWKRGERAVLPLDVDLINEALLPEWLAVPPGEAIRLALTAAEAVDREVATLSAAEIAAITRPDVPIRLDRARHRNEHLDQIERVLG